MSLCWLAFVRIACVDVRLSSTSEDENEMGNGDGSAEGDGFAAGDEPVSPSVRERVLLTRVRLVPDEPPLHLTIDIRDPLMAGAPMALDIDDVRRETPFGTYYVERDGSPITEELRLDEQGHVTVTPVMPDGLPGNIGSTTFSPDGHAALLWMGVDRELYEVQFDDEGRVLDAHVVHQLPNDPEGSMHTGPITMTNSHALFETILVGMGEGDGPFEVRGLWLLELDTESVAVELLVPDHEWSPYDLGPLLVGNMAIYNHDADQNGVPELHALDLDDLNAPSLLLGTKPVGASSVQAQASPHGARIVYSTTPGNTVGELYIVDLDDLDQPPVLVSADQEALAPRKWPVEFVFPDRLVYAVSDGSGKPSALMSVDLVDGVPQPPVQITDGLLNKAPFLGGDLWPYRPEFVGGGVLYAGSVGGSAWVAWVDLSGPSIPEPVHLHDGLDNELVEILVPATGTRVVYLPWIGGNQRLFSIDLANLDAPPLALTEALPMDWTVWGLGGWGGARLVHDDRQLAFLAGPSWSLEKLIARVSLDGSTPLEELTALGDDATMIFGEIASPQ